MPFDLLFYVRQLHHVPTLARRLAGLPLVIDHLAKPHIREGKRDDWLPHFKAAAAFPNVFCKLSGLITEADWQDWQVADLKPYVQTALECFGPGAACSVPTGPSVNWPGPMTGSMPPCSKPWGP